MDGQCCTYGGDTVYPFCVSYLGTSRFSLYTLIPTAVALSLFPPLLTAGLSNKAKTKSMSNILTVSISYNLSSLSFSAFTIVFTPPKGCSTRWLNEGDDYNVYSQYRILGVLINENYFAECSPYLSSRYSPGMCVSGQTIANITALEYGTTQAWRGYCCPR